MCSRLTRLLTAAMDQRILAILLYYAVQRPSLRDGARGTQPNDDRGGAPGTRQRTLGLLSRFFEAKRRDAGLDHPFSTRQACCRSIWHESLVMRWLMRTFGVIAAIFAVLCVVVRAQEARPKKVERQARGTLLNG